MASISSVSSAESAASFKGPVSRQRLFFFLYRFERKIVKLVTVL